MYKFNPLGKLHPGQSRAWLLIALAMTLVACGGGSSDGGATPTNRSPVANAGSDQFVLEMSLVQLAGSGSDPDAGDTLTFAWSQTAGTAVTLSSASSASPSFNAPDVVAGTPEVLTFRLTVSDSAGLSASDNVSITVQEPAAVVTISGSLRYEFPPPRAACDGLNFSGVLLRPMRQVTVQLLNATGTTVLDSAVSDDNGAYSLTANASTDVIVRVRAELKKSGSSSWDVEVRNNVDTDPNPVPLNQRPLYVMDSSVFDSGVTDQTLDLSAETGWGGSGYTGPRVAAPFSVLDAIYSAMSLVAAEDPAASFAPLDAFWSPDNIADQGTGEPDENIASGKIGTSFYSLDSLFLLGSTDGNGDTEEFDDHVIVHEWGHYFEDNFSRSDSIGGSHGIGDRLDMRLAFGEGWATALSGIALSDPTYCDTFGSSGFRIDIESGNPGTEGWFNELSIAKLIYDLWDTNNDGADNASIGFGPIYDVMTGPQSTTAAFTSIFSFATNLKSSLNAENNTFVDALLTEQDIVANGIDIYGNGETNDGPATPDDVLPIYNDLTLGVTTRICTNSQFDSKRFGNKLSEHRYLRLSLATTRSITLTVSTVSPPSVPADPDYDCVAAFLANDPEVHMHSDPDILFGRAGLIYIAGDSCVPNIEEASSIGLLSPGEYIADLNEFRHADDESPQDFPEQICFDVTAN